MNRTLIESNPFLFELKMQASKQIYKNVRYLLASAGLSLPTKHLSLSLLSPTFYSVNMNNASHHAHFRIAEMVFQKTHSCQPCRQCTVLSSDHNHDKKLEAFLPPNSYSSAASFRCELIAAQTGRASFMF